MLHCDIHEVGGSKAIRKDLPCRETLRPRRGTDRGLSLFRTMGFFNFEPYFLPAMPRISSEGFLARLPAALQSSQASGSFHISVKQLPGASGTIPDDLISTFQFTPPTPAPTSSVAADSRSAGGPALLVRARTTAKDAHKLSAVVSASEFLEFNSRLTTLLKASLTALRKQKRKPKAKKTATVASAAAPQQ
jgi:hypothetical protein